MNTKTTLAGLALALTLAGCSATAPAITTAPAPTTATQTQAPKTPAPTTPSTASFGDTATFPDGLKVTATAATRPAGQYAIGAIDGTITEITLTLTNTGTAPINAVFSSIPTVSAGPNGVPAQGANDETSVIANPATNLLPGETQTITNGYGISAANLGDVRVQVTDPDMLGAPAVFKGSVK